MSKRDDEMDASIIIPNGVTTIEVCWFFITKFFVRIFSHYISDLENHLEAFQVPYEEGRFWATISYFELNTRVGEQYKVSSPTVEIDGFTDPTSNPSKICLGLLSNVNRNQQIESTRRRIGRGLIFHNWNY